MSCVICFLACCGYSVRETLAIFSVIYLDFFIISCLFFNWLFFGTVGLLSCTSSPFCNFLCPLLPLSAAATFSFKPCPQTSRVTLAHIDRLIFVRRVDICHSRCLLFTQFPPSFLLPSIRSRSYWRARSFPSSFACCRKSTPYNQVNSSLVQFAAGLPRRGVCLPLL